MKRFPRFLLAMLIFSLLFTACAVTSRNALIGRWDNQAQGLVLEFTMDGHMRQTTQGATQEIGFQFIDDNNITFLVPGATAPQQPIAFTIAGDTLTLHLGADATSGQPQTLDFTRLK